MRGSVQQYAERIHEAFATCTSIEPITASDEAFDLEKAYATAKELRSMRTNCTTVGRKIGFSNR